MSRLPSLAILAGGRGTRLGSLADAVPKPLVEVAGEPFLFHQLRLLAKRGASDVVICVGYLGEMVESRVGRRPFGLNALYSYDDPAMNGTLGALMHARELLPDEFLVLYGDTYLRMDYAGAVETWSKSGLPAMMSVLRNEGRWGASNASYANGRVLAYDKGRPRAEMAWIDYGLGGLSQSALDRARSGATDVADLYGDLAATGLLCGYVVSERFYEVGTPEALAETDAFLRRSPQPIRRDVG